LLEATAHIQARTLMRRSKNLPLWSVVWLGAGVVRAASAQHFSASWGAQAIPTFTQTDIVPGGRALGEGRVIMPVAMVRANAFGGRLRLVLTGNFEKYSLPHGVLAAGNWGESYEDRRHPHTLVHELMLAGSDLLGRLDGPANVFVAAGKGFVPFGTDDPMARPPVLFPVNHHLSQILERALALAGVRIGPAMLEGALFNGDEPVSPGSWPAWDRFGDSWAMRLTVFPLSGLETQASFASVHSPENRPGAGPDDRKWSASARWERRRWYGELEWARTATADGFFVFRSVLAEAAVTLPRHRPYLRIERTERPEEERLFRSRFRTIRPLIENSILATTRWTILTAGDGVEPITALVRCAPFLEASWVRIARVGGGVFDPLAFYGRTSGFSISVGLRLGAGMRVHRMGRYAPALEPATTAMPMP
jgi:hypothetical protein